MKKSKTGIKILFVYPSLSSFVRNDLEFLQKYFDVRVVQYQENKKMAFLIEMLRGVQWADITFSWFASVHAFVAVFLSKIFRKKSIVVVGGYEVARVPEIGYGELLNPRSARRVKYILEHADKVLAVSEFNKKEILKYVNSNNVELVYNGLDYDRFQPASGDRDDTVITVVHSISESTIKIKGLESFIKTAKYFPNIKFTLVGGYLDNSIERLKRQASSNVEFLDFIQNKKLIKLYQKARVYCQLSYRESFGMALAEAMSCGCVPVVTDRGAIPEVVGNTGFYVPYGDEKATANAIKKALESPKDLGKKARQRIISQFPLKKREERLHDIITGLIAADE